MSDPTIKDAVAIVPVSSIEQTVAFYADVLGFSCRFVSPDGNFAIMKHGEAAIHFLQTGDAGALHATANNIAIYLWTHRLEELYRQLTPKLAKLPEGRVRAPFEQPYGVREFHVKDPDGCLLFFAQAED